MQLCKDCGAEIRYIATGAGSAIKCDAELVPFVTENGRKTYGYLIHNCKKNTEAEDAKSRRITDNGKN